MKQIVATASGQMMRSSRSPATRTRNTTARLSAGRSAFGGRRQSLTPPRLAGALYEPQTGQVAAPERA